MQPADDLLPHRLSAAAFRERCAELLRELVASDPARGVLAGAAYVARNVLSSIDDTHQPRG